MQREPPSSGCLRLQSAFSPQCAHVRLCPLRPSHCSAFYRDQIRSTFRQPVEAEGSKDAVRRVQKANKVGVEASGFVSELRGKARKVLAERLTSG